MKKRRQDGTQVSKLHKEVSRSLSAMGVAHGIEVDIKGLIVDIAVEPLRLVLEVDGPSHFLRGTQRLNGSSRFKRRLLVKQGWTVRSVPYFKWDVLDEQQRPLFLRELLQK